ncbi:hypothetical protein [Kordiimonas sp.]|uniref:hypothetical protein n=1 Tax=Kordiimonas sp. TaxID=1970157 RepID=UPI003A8D5526
MGFNEKSYIGVLATTIVVYGWYFYDAFSRAAAGQTSVAEFGPTMWIMMGVYIALMIITTVLTAIISRKEDEELAEFDERDSYIDMKSERVGSYIQACGLFALLVLVMFEYSAFVLAHAILGTMTIATLITFSMRLYMYRKGA